MAMGQDLEIYQERKDFVLNVCSKSKELLVQCIVLLFLRFTQASFKGAMICSKNSYTRNMTWHSYACHVTNHVSSDYN